MTPTLSVGLDSLRSCGGNVAEAVPGEGRGASRPDAKKANLDLAVTHGYDPNARGGRPELTPEQYLERGGGAGQEIESGSGPSSYGYDPNARGGRPELTPEQYLEEVAAQIQKENLDLTVEWRRRAKKSNLDLAVEYGYDA